MTLTTILEEGSRALLLCRHHGFLGGADGACIDARPLLRKFREDLARVAGDSRGSPRDTDLMLEALHIGARDLDRLLAAGSVGPVRSLGYALHRLPELLMGEEAFSRRLFLFNFRVAAFHWDALSPEVQLALCNLTGLSPGDAARLIMRQGFAVKIYPGDPAP